MADTHAEITLELAGWIASQPVFFVATAPAGAHGHVNVSPKGLDTLRIHGRAAALARTGDRTRLLEWARVNGKRNLEECRVRKDARSVDGLPGFAG